jgi:hypothetical protein
MSIEPLLRFIRGSEISVSVVIATDSKTPITYLVFGGDHEVVHLEIILSENDRPLMRQLFPSRVLDEENPRVLLPGEHLLQRVPISLWYGELKSGTYRLRARYDVPSNSGDVTRYGVTPLSFDRTIAYLEIVEPR